MSMHVAIIMDGNGRWGARRGRTRTAGHIEGSKAVRSVVEAAARADVHTLTLYAFSADNWQRPGPEVAALMRLFRRYLMSETQRCIEQSIRLSVIGRRDRLDGGLLSTIEQSEQHTRAGTGMHLRIAMDYSARHSILQASQLAANTGTFDEFAALLDRVNHSAASPNVDLLIRTGGEQRLSDFMLWECAYAELYFTECLWPDFREEAFAAALDEYSRRERRYGRVLSASE
jgi:undecaprenyl diphosphate synthase